MNISDLMLAEFPNMSGPAIAARCRHIRNQALRDSDWTQVSDAPVSAAAWATYRQALRDLPSQPGWPHVPMPEPPAEAV